MKIYDLYLFYLICRKNKSLISVLSFYYTQLNGITERDFPHWMKFWSTRALRRIGSAFCYSAVHWFFVLLLFEIELTYRLQGLLGLGFFYAQMLQIITKLHDYNIYTRWLVYCQKSANIDLKNPRIEKISGMKSKFFVPLTFHPAFSSRKSSKFAGYNEFEDDFEREEKWPAKI